jgi:hypothetical protein
MCCTGNESDGSDEDLFDDDDGGTKKLTQLQREQLLYERELK